MLLHCFYAHSKIKILANIMEPVIALLGVLVLVIVGIFAYRDYEGFLLIPVENRVPVVNALQHSFWHVSPSGTPFYLRFQNHKRLRWFGLDRYGGPLEMLYDIVNPSTIIVHTPSVSDYHDSPDYYRFTLVDQDTVELRIWRGFRPGAPIYLKRVAPTIYN